MVARIVDETNLYSTYDVNRGSISTCPEEIEHFLGILLQMCIVQMPRYRMYWQSSTRYEQVANIMSRDRFELIKRFLHFEDNSNAPDPKDPNKDKLFKDCEDYLVKLLSQLLLAESMDNTHTDVIEIEEYVLVLAELPLSIRSLTLLPFFWTFAPEIKLRAWIIG
eukprot:gene5701-10950_t